MATRIVRGGSRTVLADGVPLGTVFQTIDGFGSTVRELTHTDMWWLGGVGPAAPVVLTAGEIDAIHDATYDPATGIGLSRARGVGPTTDPAGGVRTYSVQATEGGAFVYTGPRVDDMASYFVEAAQRGCEALEWAVLRRETWMGGTTSTTPPAGEVTNWVNWAKAIIQRYSDQGAPLTRFAIKNEPDYSYAPMSKEFTLAAIKELCPQLAAAGLTTDVMLPDGNKASTAKTFVDYVMADPVAAQYVTALVTHIYDEALSNLADMQSRAETYGLPLFITEVSKTSLDSTPDYASSTDIQWAGAVHDMLVTYDAAAIDFMMGPFGEHEDVSLIQLGYEADGTYTGLTYRKIARYMGQFAKYVRPGDIRVSCSSSDAGAKVSAYWRADGTRTVVAVNTTGSPITTTISAADLAGKTTASVIRSSGSENWAAQTAQAISGAAFSATLPATSVSTFVA